MEQERKKQRGPTIPWGSLAGDNGGLRGASSERPQNDTQEHLCWVFKDKQNFKTEGVVGSKTLTGRKTQGIYLKHRVHMRGHKRKAGKVGSLLSMVTSGIPMCRVFK